MPPTDPRLTARSRPRICSHLAFELLSRKHERPIVRMERLDLARGVEDRPSRVGLVAGHSLLDEQPFMLSARTPLVGVEQRRDRFAVVDADYLDRSAVYAKQSGRLASDLRRVPA